MHSHWILIDETHFEILSISQFHFPPLPGYCGALARLVSPRGRAFANPELLTRTRFPIRTSLHRRFYWKNRERIGSFVKDGKKLKRIAKACSRFYAFISSLLIKPELHMSETRELSTWINVFLVIESSSTALQVILFEEHPFILIKLFIAVNFTAHY